MVTWAIEAEHLAKRYRVGRAVNHYPTLRESLAALGRRALGHAQRFLTHPTAARPEDFWALNDVGFTIPQGQAVGIIGRNGAGKSTLLKILTRITRPTRGVARIRGRVGSLLEVGAGFHPELTGRENVYLNGAILGMSRAEIRARFDRIVEFADIGTYLDTPLKHYSSGMGVRLAFSVAAHLEPEVLLVDEVLAVGDRAFQKKCIGKIGEATNEGRTVLFVSHDLTAIANLTSRCLMLSRGSLVADGTTEAVVNQYLASFASAEDSFRRDAAPDGPRVQAVTLKTSDPNNTHRFGQPFVVDLDLVTPRPLRDASLSVQVLSDIQQPVLHLFIDSTTSPLLTTPGLQRVTCRVPRLRLFLGRYTLRARIYEHSAGAALDQVENICPFEVVMTGTERLRGWQPKEAVYLEDAEWRVTPSP